MASHQKLYTTIAFLAGILITLGYKDFYPDLERRFRHRRKSNASQHSRTITDAGAGSRFQVKHSQILLTGTGAGSSTSTLLQQAITNGIEGAIGHTPLLRIKSLSEKTGCEILAKAEASMTNRL